jgi:hypothetical protein
MKTLSLKHKLSIIAFLLICTAFFQACKKDKTATNSAYSAREFTTLFGPRAQQLQINANISNTFTLQGGTKITIPANAFRINGNPVNGNVVITAGEFLKRSHIVFSGTNTNHISGAPLESDGFIYLNASVNGTNVDKQLGALIQIAIPTTNTRSTQIWEGVESVGEANQMAWQAPQGQGAAGGVVGVIRESSPISGFYNFDMGTLGWRNCDVFYANASPKTTVNVTLTNNPGSFATIMGLTGETFVFFCAKGSNVVAQLYNQNGPNTVKSYESAMPIGAEGKYISFSIKNGKYYFAEQTTTIVANQHITLNLAETTEAAIQEAINALNDY